MNKLRRRLFVRSLEDRTAPATFTVLNLNDSGADSLRDCISKANAAAGADTIDFKSGLSGTIILTTGEMAVNQEVAIIGSGSTKLSISGNNASRIFNTVTAPAGTPITISGLTLTNGNSTNSSGGAIVTGDEKIMLDNCVLSKNTAKFSSGAVHSANGSTLIATNCSFIANTAGAFGGALDIFGTGSKTILKGCVVTGNSGTSGGGLYAANYVLIEDCLIAGNTATTYLGGGVRLDGTGAAGTLTIRNSTISGNSAKTGGGGIALSSFAGPFNGTLVVQNSTITNNTSSTSAVGGGIGRPSGTGSIQIESTIVSGNIGISPDISSGGVVNVKNSAIGSGTGFTKTDQGGNLPFQAHANLKLGTLNDNGGPTQTHMLLPGSPCVDVGSNPASLAFDQRGFKRDFNAAVDMGAFEVNPQTFVVDQPIDENDGNFAKGDLSLREALALTNGFANTADTITFDTIAFQVSGQTLLTMGQLVITAAVDIAWPNTFPLTIHGNNASRAISIDGAPAGTVISLTGLRLTGGKASGDGGAILAGDENLTLTKCIMTGNSTTFGGGAVSMAGDGTLTAIDCQFTNNTAVGTGGAIEMAGLAAVTTLSGCTISGNIGPQSGGVYARNELTIDGCAIFGNTTTNDVGGGVFIREGPATIRNSTISGNTAKNFGGGIALFYDFFGTLVIQNCTITNNSAGNEGGGIFRGSNKATIELTSSIVSGNTAPQFPDIRSEGTVNVNFSAIGNSSGFTLTGANNLPFGTNLKLGPLQLNGGLTPTQAVLAGSPLLDKGSNAGGATSDQRGGAYKRTVGSAPDIGAYETAKVSLVTNTNDSGPGSLRQAAFDADDDASTAGLIRFDPAVFSTPQTIVLTSGQISMFYFVEIQGPGASQVTISGNNNSSHFFVGGTGLVSDAIFSGLTLSGGKGTHGGAISGIGQSTIIRDCVLTGNTATVGGGAVSINTGKLVMERSTVANNTATKYGGGLYFFSRSAFTISESTISGNNVTNGQGGGLYFFNAAYAPAILRNSTVSGNTSSLQGGGIALNFRGNLVVQNSTITKNTSQSSGGGIARFGGQGTMTLQSTIVAQNTALNSADIHFNSATNITSDTSVIGVADQGNFTLLGANNQTGQAATPLDAKLSPLANNGGTTQTHAMLGDSPAVDKGSNALGLPFDQRGPGFPRGLGLAPDVGAFEFDPFSLVVSNTNDNGFGSLRQAIANANSLPGNNTVTFEPAVFATPQTIKLTTGEIAISEAINVNGPAAKVTIDGTLTSRIFNTASAPTNAAIVLQNLNLTNGSTTASGGAINVGDEDVTLKGCAVTNNAAAAGGGVILGAAAASLIVEDSTLSGNKSTVSDGGAIRVGGSSSVTIRRSTLSGNTAKDSGGAVYFVANGSLLIENSTLSGNIANSTNANTGGGAVYFFGTPTLFLISNSTLTENKAPTASGGAIVLTAFSGTATIQNSTVTNNSAGVNGGGIARTTGVGTLLLSSTIIAGNANVNSPDLSFDSVISINGNSNLVGVAGVGKFTLTGTGNLTGTSVNPLDAQLGPLSANGGPTQTHALLAGSPAINRGANPSLLSTDQRGPGFNRNVGVAVDIGAIESDSTGPGIINFVGGPGVTTLGVTTYNIAVTFADLIAMNVATLDDNDITVTGPAFPSGVGAKFLSVDVNANGTPRTATYQVMAPAGGFTAAHNGSYTVSVNSNQVFATSGTPVSAIPAGSFDVAIAQIFIVDAGNDEATDTDGKTSLREAIAKANSVNGHDTILFSASVFATPQSIVLDPVLGHLTIIDTLTLTGPAARLTINAGNTNRHFLVTAGAFVLTNLNLINGNSKADSGGSIIMASSGALTITGCTFSNNKSEVAPVTGGGGAIFSDAATVTLIDCTLNGNSSTFQGGGMLSGAGTVVIRNSTISNNTALRGGGFLSQGAVNFTLENSTVSGNSATETTVSGRAGGVGIFGFAAAGGSVNIRNSTITNNTAHGLSGGGVHISQTSTNPILIESTIIAGNTHLSNPDPMFVFSPDLYGPNSTDTANAWNLSVHNSLIGILTPPMDFKSASGNIVGTEASPQNAKLGPLADNGGPTLTHALLAESPAIDSGSNPAGLATDQRGSPRVLGSAADIGAFEFTPPTPVTVASVQINDGSAQRSRVTSLQITFSTQILFTGVVATAFSVSRNGGGAVGGFTATANNVGGVTVVGLSGLTGAETQNGSLADGLYTLTVFASQIVGFDGNGNGTPGDNFVLVGDTTTNKLFRLFGDADGNGTVTAFDFNALRLAYGTIGPSIFDFDADNQVSAVDFNQFRTRYGVTLIP